MKKFGSTEKCVVCVKTVYPNDKLAADERIFHKACFRCTTCNQACKLGNFASMESKTYCKPCFKKLFFSKGNYSEGFGQLKPQHQHDLKKNGSTNQVEVDTTGAAFQPQETETIVSSS
ncbi:hypothetical protein DICPUDRAFT_93132 [Dictyostelium purpureum]|uniref:LIM zinc-binding domain-containing protein n=1 Tax=Dictyostelium purpureum TaxID=5786 RepID=F1A2Q9_DICPU|nr:uncharacterized protein DICPUDRAFT_93132 [Dictyostelium purpureum]EGC29527.1 hypothetical protein DICPUDRAFT_93132 [Dictyostelium purpureum]|eukprot:XP_003293953.1 hypothetical protein DICPUDRAFT_93132 [Dictyostelium purpureum]